MKAQIMKGWNMNRTELDAELERLKKELKTAGAIHGRDLRKRIHRLEREKIIYDGFRAKAVKL